MYALFSLCHSLFFYCSLSTIRGSACGSSILNFSFHSVSHSFWPDWANQASSQLIFQHQQIQFMNPPLYTFSNISLPLFNYNYHYLLFLQSLNLGSIHNYLRPAFLCILFSACFTMVSKYT